MPDVVEVPLLRVDELELGRAAEALERGAMLVVVACAPRADRAARAAFARAVSGGWRVEDVVLHDAGHVAERLRLGAPAAERTVVRLVVDAHAELLDALNLHREKLRADGARFVLWLAGRDAYRELVRRAPDAFSFRDAVAIVHGDEPPPPPAFPEEPDALRAARARCVRVGEADVDARATAWSALCEELFGAGGEEAKHEADRLIAWAEALPGAPSAAVRRALARALCYRTPSVERRLVEQRKDLLRALALLDSEREREVSPGDLSLRVLLQTNVPAPPGYGRDTAMLDAADACAASPLDRARAARARFMTRIARDDVGHASPPPHATTSGAWARALSARDDAHQQLALGRWSDARRAFHEVASLTLPKTVGLRAIARAREAAVALRMGEVDACRRITRELDLDSAIVVAIRATARRIDALARASLGDVAGALDALREVVRLADEHGLPGELLDALSAIATLVRDGHAAGVLDDGALEAARAEVSAGLDRCVAVAGDDPPWFPILAASVRATHATQEALPVAIAQQRQALATAEAHAPILAPEAGCTLARLLVRAGEHEEADALAASLVPRAHEQGVRRVVVWLRAVRVLAAATRDDLEGPLGALRAAFDESGAVPLQVSASREVGAELARRGRGDAARALIEPALGLAQEMPWPEEQGLLLEALGSEGEASAHYARWGLELRRVALEARRRVG